MEDARTLAQALAAAPRKRHTQAYPRELRARVVVFGLARRARGVSWRSLGRELGVRPTTVRRWCQAAEGIDGVRAETAKGFAAVRVVEGVAQDSGGFDLVSPTGWRVQGLTVQDIAAVVRLSA